MRISRIAAFVIAAMAATPLSFTLRIQGEKELHATISGPEADLAEGEFHGTIALNDSPAELPLAGTVGHADGRWKLPVTVRYADVPADWADRFRAETFTYRLKGSVGGGAPREWTGTRPWKEVAIESDRQSGADFLKLEDVHLTQMSLLSSEAEAQLEIRNPFAFPLKIAETEYTLSVNGQEVGEGGTHGMVLHAAQNNVLTLPIEVDHGALLSAAGKALLAGGEIAARIHGKLVVRLKGGDLTVPLDLSGHLTNAS
ncbi:MAG TPA: LEA type 2 family protein [Thermoanaerobaculia bacterium]|jgi:LEA14-like dessication related protein